MLKNILKYLQSQMALSSGLGIPGDEPDDFIPTSPFIPIFTSSNYHIVESSHCRIAESSDPCNNRTHRFRIQILL